MSHLSLKCPAASIAHNHLRGTCPVTGDSHDFCPPQKGDIRSPCPALNTLANHGYLPRNGKSITLPMFARALQQGYKLSTFFSWFLSIGSFLLLLQFSPLSLGDLARHNHIEHDASLVHQNAELEAEYAPCKIDQDLVEKLFDDGRDGVMTAECIARARVRRENVSPPLDGMHAEIARGEMAIALRVFSADGANEGIPLHWFRQWIQGEHMPVGWKPKRTIGIMEVIKESKSIRAAMQKMQDVEDKVLEIDAIKEHVRAVEESEFEDGEEEGDSVFSINSIKDTPPTSEDECSENEK